ncbi:MAG: hypothetical protein M0P16_02465 [Syntrophales bacterium]|jgi:hypothetical protein|nr:hypothetical protein [Syntrophales bacterium]MCK9392542.1 hypothetical protein [Syntrophales bacterium]
MEKKETNRIYWILAAAVIAISIIATGMAFSLSPQMESSGNIHDPYTSPRRPPMPAPIPFGVKLLLHAQELNVLSQLTGKSVDIIKEQTRCKPLPEFLDENGITPELFRTVMEERALILVKQASVANIITKGQTEEIIDMINKQAIYYEIYKGKRRIENGP